MILDIPELLLKVAHYSDWHAVHALQRLNRAAFRDRPVLVQEQMWHCAVRTRWPWACVDGWFPGNFTRCYARESSAWITACGSWRRVYAYLRTVGFVAAPSLTNLCDSDSEDNDLNDNGGEDISKWKPPSLRVSRTPAYNPRYGLGARNPPLSRVEECAWSEEPLIEASGEAVDQLRPWCGLAYVRPGLPAGPEAWLAHFTAYAPDAEGLILGVRTDNDEWYIDIGEYLEDTHSNPQATEFIPNNGHQMFVDQEEVEQDVFKHPVRLRLRVHPAEGVLALDILHTLASGRVWPAKVGSLRNPDLAAAAGSGHRLHLFVAFGALYNPEENAKYELPSDVDEWDPWSDHYPERLHRTGYVTLDELHPVSIIEKTRNL